MLTHAQLHDAVTLLPFLANTDSPVAREFAAATTLVNFPAGATIFEAGDVCHTLAILAAGQVRVFTIGETGREITLYRFERGESCILSTSCILSEREFPAIAVVEQAARAYAIPHTVFQTWINTYQVWRSYSFDLLARRFASVLTVLEEVAFRRMDTRIAELLLRSIAPAAATPPAPILPLIPVLHLTHQQIAAELGTSREVVSRILADFAEQGLVQQSRGRIAITDRAGLARRVG